MASSATTPTPGLFRRLLYLLKRLLLNKSSEEYIRQLAGGEQYWREALRAELALREAASAAPSETPSPNSSARSG